MPQGIWLEKQNRPLSRPGYKTEDDMGFKETGTALAGFIWLMIGDQ
jgi:hypothetical protein